MLKKYVELIEKFICKPKKELIKINEKNNNKDFDKLIMEYQQIEYENYLNIEKIMEEELQKK